MDYTEAEVLQFVEENDVKFIRLAFCDIFGNMKNVSIMPGELSCAFRSGVSFDASKAAGFMNIEEADLYLFPDPATLKVLPWRPSHGRVVRLYCDIKHADGSPFEGDGRYLLRSVEEKLKRKGYTAKIGTDSEFYLFLLDENGRPTLTPFDNAGYLDVAPQDKGENVRRDICLTLEKMGISPTASHHENGPGQNEIHFLSAAPLCAADNFITFKSAVKTLASTNGLFASFLPKPLSHAPASGLHINISLEKGGINVFSENPVQKDSVKDSFISGILAHISEMTVFLNPLTNSYVRFGDGGAPEFISWSSKNLSNLLRLKKGRGNGDVIDLRSPDAACNPYLALSLILSAGLEGIEKKEKLCPPADTIDEIERSIRLPQNLKEATDKAAGSKFLRSVLPDSMIDFYTAEKRKEFENFENAADKETFEHNAYLLTV